MQVPASVGAALWSYDVDRMDDERDKRRIITNVLNRGASDAVAWVRQRYSQAEIREVVLYPLRGEWNERSLSLWTLVCGVPSHHVGQQ